AVPLIIQDHHCAITCGQALMWEVEDYFLDEITMMVQGLDVDLAEVKLSALELNYLPSAKVQAITELLFVIANQITGKGTGIFTEQQNIQAYQAALSENFASRKNIATLFTGDVNTAAKNNMRNMEKELIVKIRGGDVDAVSKDIDALLGEIMQTGAKSVRDVKGRILELLVSLSHAAVDGGMNEEAMSNLNSRFYDELYNKKTAEEIYYWTKNVVNIYSEEVRKAQNKDNFQSVYAAAEYIRRHYKERITVHQIAEKVHLSDSYLSHIFSETFGRTITEYITSVRIEYAKTLLAEPGSSISEIALECGFEDVSYFSRVFKKSEGITPRDYKKKAILV
ncbi:MAG: helix-turn-helix domain-containing protein, partial [Firmicutes bacterium]|nr:helix-turn-helix domain-containing protein [Bacillota bacterium]